jgi:hypothetical protein
MLCQMSILDGMLLSLSDPRHLPYVTCDKLNHLEVILELVFRLYYLTNMSWLFGDTMIEFQ